MLILPIQKKWFDMIRSGEKKEEYREIKPYYDKCLGKAVIGFQFSKEIVENFESIKEYNANQFKDIEIVFRNGYQSDSPKIKCKCKLRIGQGKEEWGAEKRKRVLCTRNIGGRKLLSKEEISTLNTNDWYECISILEKHWNDKYGTFDIEGKDGIQILELTTGGWSENEEIIAILSNTWFWFLWWQESKRGGYYKFIYVEKMEVVNAK